MLHCCMWVQCLVLHSFTAPLWYTTAIRYGNILVDKTVPIALILPSRWRYGAESLGMERTSCLCYSGCPIPPIKDQYAVVFDPLTCLIKVRIQIRSLHTASATTRMTKMKLYFWVLSRALIEYIKFSANLNHYLFSIVLFLLLSKGRLYFEYNCYNVYLIVSKNECSLIKKKKYNRFLT